VYSVGGIETETTGAGNFDVLAGDGYVYDPSSGQWYRIAPMPVPVLAPSAAFVDGRLYVIGGIGLENPLTIVQIYNPATNSWTEGTSMPAGRWAAGTAVINGDIYVVGGCADGPVCDTAADTVYAYDPATDGWTQFASYPLELAYPSCGGISGSIYCAGGFDPSVDNGTDAAYSYSPRANAWTQQASMPADVWGASSAADDGQLLVAGGITAEQTTNQVYTYTPASDTWSPLPTLSIPEYLGGGACGFYILGGNEGSNAFDQLSGYGECSAGVPWLSASASTVTIPAHSSVTVTLTLNAAAADITQPGTYTAQLNISTNTPYEVTPVTVTMTATPPPTWAQVTGTVKAADCQGNSDVVSDATVQIDTAAGDHTLKTDAHGQYSLWLPASDGPLSVIVAANGYLAQATTVAIAAGKTSTYNATLKPATC
jgi:N-acetylneuraminic acid mutarotase